MPDLYRATLHSYPVARGSQTESIVCDRETMVVWLRATADRLENDNDVVRDLPVADGPRRGFIPLRWSFPCE